MVKQYVHRIGLATALVAGTTNAFQASIVLPPSSSTTPPPPTTTTATRWQQHRPIRTPASQLYLLPEQGSQLAAAFHAACGKVEEAKEGETNEQVVIASAKVATINKSGDVQGIIPSTPSPSSSSTPPITPLSAARAFVARLFSLPSSRIRRHPHPKAEGFTEDFNKKLDGDKVDGTTSNVAASAAASSSSSSTGNIKTADIKKITNVDDDDNDDETNDTAKDQDDVVLYPMVGFTFVQSKADGTCTALPTTSHPHCRLPITNKQEEVYGWFSPACELNMFAEDPCHQPADPNEDGGEQEAPLVDMGAPLN